MKHRLTSFVHLNRKAVVFLTAIVVSAAVVLLFLSYYFHAYKNPFMKKELIDLSENWQYTTGNGSVSTLNSLRSGPMLKSGETLVLHKQLETQLDESAILIRTNHQNIKVSLSETILYEDTPLSKNSNPGMALHFILLPQNHLNQMLEIELTSPYTLYSGRTSPIYYGTIPSLEAFALSASMRSLILMAMCLLLGLSTVIFTLVQCLQGYVQPQNLAIGIFAVVWSIYYVCTEYIVFQFFSPVQVSQFSLGLYYIFPLPLTLFFYFSFKHYKRQMLPAVVLHFIFAVSAIALQLLNIVDFPQLININNLLLLGLIYTVFLAFLEARKKNLPMLLSVPFLILSYISMLYNFSFFYHRTGIVPYSYRDTYFLFILCVLIYDVQQFFSGYYQKQRQTELLTLQNRLATENYEQAKVHLQQVGVLKHNVKNQLAALQMYLQQGRYTEAKQFLEQYAVSAKEVTDTVYHENMLVNATANNLLRQAKEENIQLDLNLPGMPAHIQDPDLYNLLWNITENALEACRRMPEGAPRFIHLSFTRKEPYLHIYCKNSYDGNIILDGDEPQSSKAEGNHGFGLKTIEFIADKYDGMMDIEHSGCTFTIRVALKDPQ